MRLLHETRQPCSQDGHEYVEQILVQAMEVADGEFYCVHSAGLHYSHPWQTGDVGQSGTVSPHGVNNQATVGRSSHHESEESQLIPDGHYRGASETARSLLDHHAYELTQQQQVVPLLLLDRKIDSGPRVPKLRSRSVSQVE